MKWEWIILIIALIGFALSSRRIKNFKLPFDLSTLGRTDSEAAGTPAQSGLEQFGWVLAIGGWLFFYFCVSQILPEFWREWRQSDGFFWMQAALVVGFILWHRRGVAGTVGTFILTFAVIACLATSCGAWTGAKKTKAEAKAAKQAAFMATNVVAQATAKAEQERRLDPVNRRWEYGYIKPPGVIGILPDRRKETFEAKIIRYDAVRFDFAVFLPDGTTADFSWNRFASTNGVWAQKNPPNHGEWNLEPEKVDRENRPMGSFHGWETNFRGEITSIWLRPKD